MTTKGKPPSLVALTGGKYKRSLGVGKPRGTGKRVTTEVWRAMDDWWVRSARSPYELARKFGVAAATAENIVHKGYPRRGLPPLKDRAIEYDEKMLSRTTHLANQDETLVREANEWAKTKRTNITAIRNTRGLIALVQNELITRWRVDKGDGKRPLEDINPTDLRASIGVVKSMASAIKDLGEEERRWLQGAAPENEDGGSDNPFADLSEEQLAWITEHGRLPPDLDPAKFYGNLGLALGKPPEG